MALRTLGLQWLPLLGLSEPRRDPLPLVDTLGHLHKLPRVAVQDSYLKDRATIKT